MGLTTVDLYRMGNATSARLDHVRPNDIYHFDFKGVRWVRAGTGGISTYDAPISPARRWWCLPAGYDYGPLMIVRNDNVHHWSWEPLADMPLGDYRALLDLANRAFR